MTKFVNQGKDMRILLPDGNIGNSVTVEYMKGHGHCLPCQVVKRTSQPVRRKGVSPMGANGKSSKDTLEAHVVGSDGVL